MKIQINNNSCEVKFGVCLSSCRREGMFMDQITINIKELKSPKFTGFVVIGHILRQRKIFKRLYYKYQLIPALKIDGEIILENSFGQKVITSQIKRVLNAYNNHLN